MQHDDESGPVADWRGRAERAERDLAALGDATRCGRCSGLGQLDAPASYPRGAACPACGGTGSLVDALRVIGEDAVAWLAEAGETSTSREFAKRLREVLGAPGGTQAARAADTLAPPPGEGPATLAPGALAGAEAADDEVDAAWLASAPKGRRGPHPDPERAAGYVRLEGALAGLPLREPRADWKERLEAGLDAIDAERAAGGNQDKEGTELCRMPS